MWSSKIYFNFLTIGPENKLKMRTKIKIINKELESIRKTKKIILEHEMHKLLIVVKNLT